MNREDIHTIVRHSNWSESGVNEALRQNVYNDKIAWKKFLNLLLIAFGVCFTVAGILFFFAYNWEDLNKFAKIGILEGLLIFTTLLVFIPKIKTNIKNIILTGSAVLTGVLLAVYGQVYQTGADSYLLFLAWCICIFLWVVVSDFAPLWLIYIALINTTVWTYATQMSKLTDVEFFGVFFFLNLIALFAFTVLSKVQHKIIVPTWFQNVLALTAISFSTLGMMNGIFERHENAFLPFSVITMILYAGGLAYGFFTRNRFYLAVIPFSLIIIISTLLIKSSDGEMMFLSTSIFIIASVSLVVKMLLMLQKKWTMDN